MPRVLTDAEMQSLGFEVPQEQPQQPVTKGHRLLSDQEAAGLGLSERQAPSNPIAQAAKGVGRQLARTGVRAAEAAVGAPFDIANLALSGANLAHRGITGEYSPSIQKVQEALPTAESLRKNVSEQYLPESITQPQNEYEQLTDNLVSDFVNIITPVGAIGLAGKGVKAAKAAAKSAAAVSGLGNIAGFMTKKVTGSQGAGDIVKAGTMLATSIAGAPKMFSKGAQLYQDLEQAIPATLNTSTKPLLDAEHAAQNLMKGHGGTDAAKAFTDYFNGNAHLFNNPSSAPLKEIIQARKGFNTFVKENPAMWKDLNPAVKSLREGFDNAVKGAGRPDIYKAFKGANEFWSEAVSAARTQTWMDKVANSISKNPLSLSAQVLLGVASPSKIPYLAATQGASAGLKGISSIVKRTPGFLRSPTVRRYYMSTLLSAANQNRPGFIKHAKQLDKALENETFNQFLGS